MIEKTRKIKKSLHRILNHKVAPVSSCPKATTEAFEKKF